MTSKKCYKKINKWSRLKNAPKGEFKPLIPQLPCDKIMLSILPKCELIYTRAAPRGTPLYLLQAPYREKNKGTGLPIRCDKGRQRFCHHSIQWARLEPMTWGSLSHTSTTSHKNLRWTYLSPESGGKAAICCIGQS